MTSNGLIRTLWELGKLPIHDGLYRSDGASYSVRIERSAPSGLLILGPIDLEAILAREPDYLTSVDVTSYWDTPDLVGRLGCGEGAHGSEGFFARFDASDELVWVVYLEDSNPFEEVKIEGSLATFISTSGVRITVDLDSYEFGLPGTRRFG